MNRLIIKTTSDFYIKKHAFCECDLFSLLSDATVVLQNILINTPKESDIYIVAEAISAIIHSCFNNGWTTDTSKEKNLILEYIEHPFILNICSAMPAQVNAPIKAAWFEVLYLVTEFVSSVNIPPK